MSLLGEGDAPRPAEGEGGEGKPAAAESAFVPLTINDIKLPEGFADLVFKPAEGEQAADTMLSRALAVMNNVELAPATRMEKLVELQAMATAQLASEMEQSWQSLQSQWRQEAQALPEIGGANLGQTLAQIKKGLETVGADKAFFDAMNLTGAGNHPKVIQVLHALTRGLTEAKPVLGDPPKGKIPVEHRLYPTMAPKE